VSVSAAPLFEDTHVVKITPGEYGPRGMPGDIIALKDGKLLLCYTVNGIQARTSSDQGRTWGEQFDLAPNPKPPSQKGYYCHPSFLRLPNGDLLLSYIYATGDAPYYGHNYYRRSADEGKTWSEQFIMTPAPGYSIMHNDKWTLLSTGRIIAPTEHKARWPAERDHEGYVCRVFYSDDNGYSWWMAKNDVDMEPHEAQEPECVELKDGRLLMTFRTYSGFVGFATSTDKGETWSKGELRQDLPLPSSGAVTIKRIPTTGDLLLIRATGSKARKRAPLTAMISQDEGQTWTHPRDIGPDPNNDYGYQSVDFLGDVAIISYHALDGLHVARIGVDWFYGK
jgi:sialidase-1